jgi:SAM-dependent methyltransferase
MEPAQSFNAVAAQYAAARPGYPPALLDAVEAIARRPLRGADALDIGAGTGIATRLLRERGAHVTAVEPGADMAAQLRADQPDAPLVRADGNALPFADGTADLITYAQSWHWTDPARSVPEALRVLRPGGAPALWWNVPDLAVPWAAAQEARLDRRMPGYHQHGLTGDAEHVITGLGLGPALRTESRSLRWTRSVPLDTHLAMLGSRSYFAVLGEAAAPILADERRELLKVFPDGTVVRPYGVDVTVAVKVWRRRREAASG